MRRIVGWLLWLVPLTGAAQNITVYADALGNGWQNWSWATVKPLQSGLFAPPQLRASPRRSVGSREHEKRRVTTCAKLCLPVRLSGRCP